MWCCRGLRLDAGATTPELGRRSCWATRWCWLRTGARQVVGLGTQIWSQCGYSGSGLGEGEATDEASHPAAAMGMQVSAVGVADAWRCSEGRSEGGLTDWLSTSGFRGLGENPFLAMAGACDGGVRGRRDLPEGVDGMLSLPLRGTTPGETPNPTVGCWRRVNAVPLSRASILKVNPVRGASGCVGRLGDGRRCCGVETSVAR